MDEAYKHTLTNASLTLNTSKEILEIYQKLRFWWNKNYTSQHQYAEQSIDPFSTIRREEEGHQRGLVGTKT